MYTIDKIGIAGAGAMGLGIAQVFALASHQVILYDVQAGQLERAKKEIQKNLDMAVSRGKISEQDKQSAINRISFVSDIDLLKGDMIVEAIVEKVEAKRDLFNRLAAVNAGDTIFATNTSSIPVTSIAQGIPFPGRVLGMHFFNPAPVMKLVEIIAGAETKPEVLQTVKAIAEKIGKVSIMCKDSPGFIVNRVARHYYVESLKQLEEGVATIENIDTLMEAAGFKMGPFKLMDHVGNDINFAVTSSLFESFHHEPRFRPSRIQRQKVDAGHLGKKTSKGFYNYD